MRSSVGKTARVRFIVIGIICCAAIVIDWKRWNWNSDSLESYGVRWRETKERAVSDAYRDRHQLVAEEIVKKSILIGVTRSIVIEMLGIDFEKRGPSFDNCILYNIGWDLDDHVRYLRIHFDGFENVDRCDFVIKKGDGTVEAGEATSLAK